MRIQVNCDLAILVLAAIQDCSPDGGKNLVFLNVLLSKKAVLRVLRLDSSYIIQEDISILKERSICSSKARRRCGVNN